MMKIRKNNAGITLVTLSITIIVLLILSTVAISSGKQAIENSRLTTFTAEMKIMQSEVNILYDKYSNDGSIKVGYQSYNGYAIIDVGEEVDTDTYETAFTNAHVDKNDRKNYKVYDKTLIKQLGIDGIERTYLVNVPKRKVISAEGIKYKDETYYTLEDLPNGLYNPEYSLNENTPKIGNIEFENIEGDKWRIKVSNIEYEGYINKWNVKYKLESEKDWNISKETSFIVKESGTYDIKIFNDKVESSESKKIQVNHSETIVPIIYGVFENNENIKEVREGNIPIPKGYSYVKGDKIGGVVITDAEDGGTGGNEFVWIPVDDINAMASTDIGGTDGNGNTNYRGVLYNFNSNLTQNTEIDWTESSTSYREPTNLTGNITIDETEYTYDTQEIFTKFEAGTYQDTMYQEEYNRMVKQVAIYHGFYVGRYEMSLDDLKIAQSKSGNTSANASDQETHSWYGLYEKAKTYAIDGDTSKSVVSSMIWGSQYDAMIRWMQSNGIDVTEANASSTLQNALRNEGTITGGEENKDILNNVYDILGNKFEWTQEARNADYRVCRAGNCNDVNSPSNRCDYNPSNTSSICGSRLTLYIK